MCWLIEVMVKFQISSLKMKSYKVTIQMKATAVLSCDTVYYELYNFEPVVKFNFVRSESVALFFWHYFMHFLVHYFHKINLGIFFVSFMIY